MMKEADSDAVRNRRYALCVGIGTYASPAIRSLRYAVADTVTIAERLGDLRRGNFITEVLTEPIQTTKAALDDAVERMLNAPDRQAEDILLLYFSCHGDVNSANNAFCLLPSDATPRQDGNYEQATVIGISDIGRWFSGSRAHNIVLLLDVCHSGGAGAALQHFKPNLDAGPNFFIIGAARQDQVTTESSSLGHGLFTHCLLRAFAQPPDTDGWLTISQIQDYVSKTISWYEKDKPLQIQVSSTFVDLHIPILRNPGYPELAPLPPIWNVPFQRNPFFTEQENLLSQLASLLQSEQKTALTQPYALSGLGGIGKTQLALEYAYRHRQDYHAILWGRADTREALISTFVNIAQLLGLSQKDEQDQMAIVESVKAWLMRRSQWLFVLDNADELALVEEFLPSAFGGHLLLTTRAQSMGELAHKLEVQVMQPELGALLLLRRAGLVKPDALLEAASSADILLAQAIAEELGGLPLALDQAGAYIEETQSSLSAYRSLYHTHRAKLLRVRGGLRGDHPESVATTWSLNFQQVKKQNPAAADLLRLCAFLSPDAIPEEIITGGAKHFRPSLRRVALDPFTLDKAVKELGAYSLLRRDTHENAKPTLSLHRLVQAVLKDNMSEATRAGWAECTIRVVESAFPDVKFETWSVCERLLPHALACTELVEHYHLLELTSASLLNRVGWYLRDRARYHEAKPLLVRSLAIRKQILGSEHPDMAQSLNNLALLYQAQGKYEQAEPLYQRALVIYERQLGGEHPDTAQSLNNLAELYREQSKYEQAEPLLVRALSIDTHAYGDSHPEVATDLNNLALLYQAQGKYEQAESLYQRALAIRKQHLGGEHPDIAQSLNNLAFLYHAQGKYEQAEPLYQRALAIHEHLLGPEHPHTATSLNNLAALYDDEGKYEQAESLYQRALAIRERQLGGEHPSTATSLNNLAFLYHAQGKYEQAEPLLVRGLSIREQQLGGEHPLTAQSLNNLANLYRVQSKYEQAEPLLVRALNIYKQQLGDEHPLTASGLASLAALYQAQDKYEQAEPLLVQALLIRKQQLGDEHPDTQRSRRNYASLMRAMGHEEEATAIEGKSTQ